MKRQFTFQKNSEYDKEYPPKEDIAMFEGIVHIEDGVYDGKIYRTLGRYGREELILCLETEDTDAPF